MTCIIFVNCVPVFPIEERWYNISKSDRTSRWNWWNLEINTVILLYIPILKLHTKEIDIFLHTIHNIQIGTNVME